LSDAKRADGRALDPVAHFHLSNGARIERINWLADRSSKGVKQSAAMMVNYLYRLSDIEANHEAYASEGSVALASGVRSLL
jgi:malonyl-CoA decarboxylase